MDMFGCLVIAQLPSSASSLGLVNTKVKECKITDGSSSGISALRCFSSSLILPYTRAENRAHSTNGAFNSTQVFIWLRQSLTLPFTCQQFKVNCPCFVLTLSCPALNLTVSIPNQKYVTIAIRKSHVYQTETLLH